MAFLNSLSINGSALTASRLRLDIISENIANASTTRTENGGPYRRKMVVYEPASNNNSFESMFKKSLGIASNADAKGVKVTSIVDDQTPFTLKYDPTHPDADEQGYVQMPNVDPIKETIDMMAVTRAYEANVTAFNAVKNMALKALELGR